MTAVQPDPILTRLIQEYEYWKAHIDSGGVGMVTIDIRPYLPERKRVTSYGRRERIDKGSDRV